MKIVLIAAMDRNAAIGSGNALPWHCPQDLRHFQRMTMGKVLLMGRKTADSLKKPLRDRVNLVLTHGTYERDGFIAVGSVAEAKAIVASLEQDELWVIGGQSVYEQTIGDADVVHLTHLNIEVPVGEADAWFPVEGLCDFQASVVKTCADPNVHFWTFSRGLIQTVRAATIAGRVTSME